MRRSQLIAVGKFQEQMEQLCTEPQQLLISAVSRSIDQNRLPMEPIDSLHVSRKVCLESEGG